MNECIVKYGTGQRCKKYRLEHPAFALSKQKLAFLLDDGSQKKRLPILFGQPHLLSL
jgi:hypothetical protein